MSQWEREARSSIENNLRQRDRENEWEEQCVAGGHPTSERESRQRMNDNE